MTKKDANRIIGILQANYPDTTKDMTDDAYMVKVNLWADAFKDEPYELVAAAVKAYIANSTERFAPNIGQIKEQIRRLTHPDELTEGEAWALVQKAIRRAGYEAREEYDKLPLLVQKVVGSPNQLREWGLMNSETVQSVVASNFQRGYRTVQAREAAMEKTPLEIRQAFAQLTAPMPEALEAKLKGPRLLIGDESTPWPPAPAPEDPPVTGEALRQKIAELRIAAGEVVITEESKQAALERVRQYGKEQV